MVKKELFKNFVLCFILKYVNVFLVDCEKFGFSVIKIFVKILKNFDLSLIMFFSGMCYFLELKGGVVLIVKMG